jgi:hypothetical protein
VLAFSKIEEILRIHVCVDQCVSADWWRRQFSSVYAEVANHVTWMGGPIRFMTPGLKFVV